MPSQRVPWFRRAYACRGTFLRVPHVLSGVCWNQINLFRRCDDDTGELENVQKDHNSVYAPMPLCYGVLCTELQLCYGAICTELLLCYGVSGTDMGYGGGGLAGRSYVG
eukprot:2107863-Rhodomonas_salina.3